MVDLTEQEKTAIRATVRSIAEVMAEIGWTLRLNELTEGQVLTLIEVAVGNFQDAMRAIGKNDASEAPY